MSLFVWSDRYSVGIKKIDDQHKVLVDILNELFEAMTQKKGEQAIAKIIRNLVGYTRSHFSTEEMLLKQYAYPDYDAHKKIHDEFVQKIDKFQKDFQAGKLSLTTEMSSFLRNWLINHISGEDKKYASFLQDKGVN